MTSKWIADKIKSKIVVNPHVKNYVLYEFMHETFDVRIGNLKLYMAREKAKIDIHEDHSRAIKICFNIV